MRLPCHMAELRRANGFESLTEVRDAVGIDRGTLSRIERGRELPADGQVPALELAYGPAAGWYPAAALLLIQNDQREDVDA